MSLAFNAQEVFEIGVEIEKNGRLFYQTAAQAARDQSTRKFFTELADWEAKHVVLFEELKKALPPSSREETAWDPQEELALYLKATADTHVFKAGTDVAKLAVGCKSADEVISLALTFEKDSIVYYTTMQRAVPRNLGKDRVDRLIDEELSHILILTNKLREIG